ERSKLLEGALQDAGHEVVARVDSAANLVDAVAQARPDVILVDVDAPSRDTLESLAVIHRDQPRPIVLAAARSDADTIELAMRAVVSSYVVAGLSPERVKPILDVAIARFEQFQSLRRELDDARSKLADRRDVERAKGLLMQRRGLDEAAAYELLRRMA